MLETQTKYYENESMFHGFIPRIMGTQLDILLIHPKSNSLNKLWLMITNELEYLDKTMNRFNPTSEVAKINSQNSKSSLSISKELETILQLCQYYYEKTLHLFDITLEDFSLIKLDNNQHVSFSNFGLSLDFGGFAKGYALKKIKKILKQKNIQHAFVNFGNSSILGIGHHPYGDCWKVSLQSPYNQQILAEFDLKDTSLSTSGNTAQYTQHIINPLTRTYNVQQKAATVLSNDPLDAEILSTVWMIANEKQREQLSKKFKDIQATFYNL